MEFENYTQEIFKRIEKRANLYISENGIDTKSQKVSVVQEFNPYEVKKSNDETRDGIWISGYLSTFKNIDRHRDVVSKTAFDDTLKNIKKMGKLVMLRDHLNTTDNTAGSFPANKIKIDDVGLHVEGFISRTKQTEHTIRMIEDGHIDTLSMGGLFLYEEKVRKDKDDNPVFTIKSVVLLEGSIVSIPANPKAMFTQKSLLTENSKRVEKSKVKKLSVAEKVEIARKKLIYSGVKNDS